MELSRLVELASQVLSSDKKGSELLDLLELYSKNFNEWYLASPFASSSGSQIGVIDNSSVDNIDSENLDQYRDLSEKHNKILELAKSLEPDLSKDMREHQQKGHAILSYVDQLPKRISLRKKRKG